jgi:hypothetical protein
MGVANPERCSVRLGPDVIALAATALTWHNCRVSLIAREGWPKRMLSVMQFGFLRHHCRHVALFALLTIMLASTPVSAANPMADAVVDASPLDAIIEQYPAMMSQGIRQGLSQSGGIDPVLAQTIGGVVSRAFNAQEIRRKVEEDLGQGMSRVQLEKVLQWYETSLGERISKAEAQASSPSAWKAIEARAPALIAEYRGTNREALFARFDQATRATESTVDTAMAVQLALASAMSVFKGQNGPSFEQIRQQIESQRTMLRDRVEQQVYGAYLYTYHDFTNTEMKKYISFMESDPGSRFSRVVTDSVQQAILEPVENIGGQLMRLLNP